MCLGQTVEQQEEINLAGRMNATSTAKAPQSTDPLFPGARIFSGYRFSTIF
jgi:hypothetical protein